MFTSLRLFSVMVSFMLPCHMRKHLQVSKSCYHRETKQQTLFTLKCCNRHNLSQHFIGAVDPSLLPKCMSVLTSHFATFGLSMFCILLYNSMYLIPILSSLCYFHITTCSSGTYPVTFHHADPVLIICSTCPR